MNSMSKPAGRTLVRRCCACLVGAATFARVSAALAQAAPPPEQAAPAAPVEGDLAESEPTPLESPPQLHAFVSQGFIKTTENNYLAESERGSLEFTEAGINVTKDLTDKLRVGMQLFARRIGPIGGFSVQFDWFYLDYRFFDWLGVRVGRTKLPFGLYNETSDVDAARVPVLLPQSVYPIQNRDFLLAQTGAELYGLVPIGDAGQLEYRLYGGTLFLDAALEGADDTIVSVSTPYIVGGRLMWLTPLEGLQLGGSIQALELDIEYKPPEALVAALQAQGLLPPNFSENVDLKIPAVLALGSVEYAAGGLLLSAEYGRWYTKIRSSIPVIVPESSPVSERFYVMASYRINEWLVPGAYYAGLFPDVDRRTGIDKYSHDFAATVRFDVNEHWLWKLEGHYMRGTANLSTNLNDDAPLNTLERDWGAFFVKTTAYF